MTCPRCSGYDPSCPKPSEESEGYDLGLAGCGGTGRVNVYRCPQSIVTRDTSFVLNAYQVFKAHNVTPVPGGWLDQSSAFVRICRRVDSERNFIRTLEDERNPPPATEEEVQKEQAVVAASQAAAMADQGALRDRRARKAAEAQARIAAEEAAS